MMFRIIFLAMFFVSVSINFYGCTPSFLAPESDFIGYLESSLAHLKKSGGLKDVIENGYIPSISLLSKQDFFNEYSFQSDDPFCEEENNLCFETKAEFFRNIFSGESELIVQLDLTARFSNNPEMNPHSKPLNLVIAVDAGGLGLEDASEGETLGDIKNVLFQITESLGGNDRVSIVDFSEDVEIRSRRTRGDHHEELNNAIEGIASSRLRTYLKRAKKLGVIHEV